ncbi:coenzyme F390 synthetase [Methylobacterium sp. WSM2598]|uniref:coenzyme F390 synthetase n=1 Tax=Methylobacterium sp. WSM2598 TaxID=398261 RepID=UPI00036C40CD|nr:coenzyme F390 synthetase [Methylobacterium sp. WSM2598]
MIALDVATGALERLPHGARDRFARAWRSLPAGLRYGRAYGRWRARIRRAAADPAFACAAQDEALAALVARARADSPAHRERLDPVLGAGALDGAALRAVWPRIPILTREELARDATRFCTTDPGRLRDCILVDRSGQSARIFLDRGLDPVALAFRHEAWARAGFTPQAMRAVFRGLDLGAPSYMQEAPGEGELRCSVLHLSDAVMAGYLEAIRRWGIAFLQGLPSALCVFAAHVLREEGPLPQVTGVLPTSEPLSGPSRATLERAFPRARLVPVYGLREQVAFAAERPGAPDCYVFDPLHGLAEIVDGSGRPLTRPGARGRLVATGLLGAGMPLIRYETGDEAELVEAPDDRNGRRLTVRRIRPRSAPETLLGRSGLKVPLADMIQLDPALLGVGAFQFVQEEPGQVTLRVVPSTGPLPDFTGFLLRMGRRLAGELDLTLEIVDRLPTSLAGKRPIVARCLRADPAGPRAAAQARLPA